VAFYQTLFPFPSSFELSFDSNNNLTEVDIIKGTKSLHFKKEVAKILFKTLVFNANKNDYQNQDSSPLLLD